ncbi:preprotein translocase subunit SecG [bacterium]|nr:preprotein translocase subunit SecG [bacterium]MCI0680009.1 preprotein translocase subunit SecG [bacterium]
MELFLSILPWAQIALSILLIAAILLQRSSAGLGGAFGGSDGGVTHTTRRGFDRTLFQATIVIAILFALSAFAAFLF